MKPTVILVFMLLILTSCEVGPQPIHYGSDYCTYCKMTIVDKQHASQLVTSKGKAYNFDSVECMMHFLKDNPDKGISLYLVNNFQQPKKFLDARRATFLKSQKITSPMGENLLAIGNYENAKKAQTEYGGQLLSWEELEQYFKIK